MNHATTKRLIWAGVFAVLIAEIVMLCTRKKPEALTQISPAEATWMRAEPRPAAKRPHMREVIPPASPALAGIDRPAPDPLPLQALKDRVQPEDALRNEALLTFKTSEAYAAFLKRAPQSGLVVKGRLDELLTARVGFSSLEDLRRELLDHTSDGAEVSANYLVAIPRIAVPEKRSPGGDVPFGDTVLSAIGITPEVDRSGWGKGVTVAVIDSGVGEHPAFRAGQVTHVDLVNDGQPFEGHGTAIASLIAGNLTGAQGVSPGVDILDVRVAGSTGDSDSFLLARGITTAVNHGADVINISMGSYGDAPVVEAAVQKALQRGVVIVAAVGNEQASFKAWPAAYPGVISVGGVDAGGGLAYFSNTGNPTLTAPAVGIPSAYWQKNKPYLATGDGTSQSAALVSGAAAYFLGNGWNVPQTLSSNAQRLQAPAQTAGAGMLRLPTR